MQCLLQIIDDHKDKAYKYITPSLAVAGGWAVAHRSWLLDHLPKGLEKHLLFLGR